ncbi:YpoC family protein [Planococcus sp. ISL-109]|uniref:YpoC family protein n=1 Tax=Planococcus sp. ISL-109 TaxID=2819166 RepID=UPI001BEC61C1|nr:hypothetical protein [Planococcus sp. ISL-109]MBT2582074.1 hypothetical protein [Planococcus sp. ISL-109]
MNLSQKSIDEMVSPFYESWQELSQDIQNCFEREPTTCRQLISKGCELYVELKHTLVILFGESSPSPLNEQERLSFVQNSKSDHAAYRQLEQLFRELKKKIARQKIGYPVEHQE